MKIKIQALCIATVLVAMLSTVGCGHYTCGATFGNSTCSSSGNGLSTGTGGNNNNNNVSQVAFLYFMDYTHGQISAEGLNVNSSQTFASIPNFVGPTFPTQSTNYQGGMAAVNKKFLYVPYLNGDLYGYAIDPTTGALTSLADSPHSVPGLIFGNSQSNTITADPSGAFVFVGYAGGISVFSINQTSGALTEVAGSPFAIGSTSPVWLATDGLGKYLYAVDGTTLYEFSYTASGMTQITTAASLMRQLVADPTGNYMLGITDETGSGGGGGNFDYNIYVFPVAKSGSTAGTLGTPAAFGQGTESPSYLAMSPDGTLLYSFNANSVATGTGFLEPIEGYKYNAGILTPLASSPFTSFVSSIGKFDQSGQYLFVIGESPTEPIAGMLPMSVASGGVLNLSLPFAGAASYNYVVTDAP